MRSIFKKGGYVKKIHQLNNISHQIIYQNNFIKIVTDLVIVNLSNKNYVSIRQNDD